MVRITIEQVYNDEKYGVMSAAVADYLTNDCSWKMREEGDSILAMFAEWQKGTFETFKDRQGECFKADRMWCLQGRGANCVNFSTYNAVTKRWGAVKTPHCRPRRRQRRKSGDFGRRDEGLKDSVDSDRYEPFGDCDAYKNGTGKTEKAA